MAVFVAENEENIEGVICVMLKKDAQWGAYIDSLHVSSALRGQGAGKNCSIMQQSGYAAKIITHRFTYGFLKITSGQPIFTKG